jgi:alpha-beta hydrolase superfamily lysophospholipase
MQKEVEGHTVLTYGVCTVFSVFSSKGFICHSYDARSHGQSESIDSERLKISSFGDLVTDLEAFCEMKRAGTIFTASWVKFHSVSSSSTLQWPPGSFVF